MIRSATLLGAALLIAGAAPVVQAQVVYYGSPVVAAPVMPAPVAVPMMAVPMMAVPMSAAPMTAVVPLPMAAAVAPAAVPVVRGYYQVKHGGRLDAVAKRVGVSLADLVRLNPQIGPRDRLAAGTLVALPVP